MIDMNNSNTGKSQIHRSAYTACVPYKDTGTYLMHSFMTGKFALLTEKQKEVFEHPAEHLSEQIIPALLEYGFLSEEDDYSVLVEKLKKANPRIPHNKNLTLEICPTMNCNFDCRYCFEAGRRRSGSMNDETAAWVAEFARKRIEETETSRLSVKWFGGEPSLEPERIRELSDRLIAVADGHGIPYNAYIQTNGYLLTQEMADMLEEKRVSTIEITIDGNKSSHDRLRVLSGGQGSYDIIMDRLFHLRTNMKLKIRCNLHKDNLSAYGDLMKDVEKMKAVTHNNIICTPRIIRARSNIPAEGTFLKDTVLTNEEYLHQFNSLYSMNHFEKPAYSDIEYFRGRMTSPCKGSNGTGFTIDELGNIYGCSMEVGNPGCVIGNVRTYENDASLARTENYEFYRSSLCTDRDQCKNCVILPVCLGRCPRTWNEYYDCERLKGNLADTMIKVYDLFQNIQTV